MTRLTFLLPGIGGGESNYFNQPITTINPDDIQPTPDSSNHTAPTRGQRSHYTAFPLDF